MWCGWGWLVPGPAGEGKWGTLHPSIHQETGVGGTEGGEISTV